MEGMLTIPDYVDSSICSDAPWEVEILNTGSGCNKRFEMTRIWITDEPVHFLGDTFLCEH